MNATCWIHRKQGLPTAPIDNEIVLLNQAKGNYIGLDNIGRRIWELLGKSVTLEELCRQLTQEFQGDPQQISKDVESFIEELRTEGLVEVSETRMEGD